VVVKTLEEIFPHIFVGFVSFSATEVHSRAANAGEIKEADSVVS
jgi:hypothetical protein